MSSLKPISEHYNPKNLLETLLHSLNQRGLQDGAISFEKLAPFDQFHSRGLQATADLASLSSIDENTRVVDIGSGLGGPSRYLAKVFGCHVTGVDRSPAYIEVAKYLAQREGLASQLNYVEGDALNLPVPSRSIDLAWIQHMIFNVADVAALFQEIRRILKPTGSLAFFEAVTLDKGAIHYPVPWADTPQTSFLRTTPELQQALTTAGFSISSWQDRTAEGLEWFADQQRLAALRDPSLPEPLNLVPALGPEAPRMVDNFRRNLAEGKLGLVQALVTHF